MHTGRSRKVIWRLLLVGLVFGLGLRVWVSAPLVVPPRDDDKQRGIEASDDNGSEEIVRASQGLRGGAGEPTSTGSGGSGGRDSGIRVIESRPARTVLSFALGDYDLEEVMYEGRTCTRVVAADTGYVLKQKDYPALPCYRSTLIVPTDGEVSVRVLKSDFVEVPCNPPLPSAGFVSRTQAKQAGFGPVYAGCAPYPAETVALDKSFMVRHVRGQGITVYPFQYHPDRGCLRLYRSLTIEIRSGADDSDLQFPSPARSREFQKGMRGLFDNYESAFEGDGATRSGGGALPAAPGPMLVVAASALADAMDGFVLWKRQQGQDVTVLRYPDDTGSGVTGIASTIRTRYEQDAVVYVVLVGDHNDLPADMSSENPSDTVYSLVSGDDAYHDLFISRISASTVTDLNNQLAKLIAYEKSPDTEGSWHDRASLVGSNEGATVSAFGLNDREILDLERTKMLNNGFTLVDQIYDPGAAKNDIVEAWNSGRSLIYYLGHGYPTSWVTTGLDVTTVTTLLSNGSALPFVLNGNCITGDFTRSGGDCLAEAIMKTGSSSNPAGGIGVAAATTDMDWDPPIVMMRAFTDMLVADRGASTGALTFFGVQEAMDYCYATPDEGAEAAQRIMEQLHLFGDCSMTLHTTRPESLSVSHNSDVIRASSFTATVNGPDSQPVAGATVCLYSDTTQIVGMTAADGTVALSTGLIEEDSMTLTVTGDGMVPYQAQLTVADGPMHIYSSTATTGFTGSNYSFQHLAIGGTAPYHWQITAGQEAWMSLHADTGLLTGTPSTVGSFSYTIQVTDAENSVDSHEVILTVADPLAISSASLPDGVVNGSYGQLIGITGGFEPYTISLAAGELPPGLSVSESGLLNGTPSCAGEYVFTLQATGAHGSSDQQQFTLFVDAAEILTIETDGILPAGERGGAYSLTFSANGGSGSGYVWLVTAGALPPGLTLSSSGTVGGTPTLEGNYTFTVQVSDDWEPVHSASQSFSLAVVSDVYMITSELPDGFKAMSYTQQLEAGGTYTPLIFSIPSSGDTYVRTGGTSTFTETGVLQNWHDDETEWTLELGFSFSFYGNTYTQCRVGDNGYLILDGNSPTDKWDANETALAASVMIAPFWTDLLLSTEFPNAGIYVDQQNDYITIRWNGRDYHTPDLDAVNMAVTLHADGRITFLYGAISSSNRIAVGISSGNGSDYDPVFAHDWIENDPVYVTGWSGHDDISFVASQPLPDGMQLSQDGLLSGTPTVAGDYLLTILVEDANGAMDAAHLNLHIADTQTWTLNLIPGWNLISTPVEPVNSAVDSLFNDGDILAAWRWEDNQYQQATELHAKEGYWLYTEQNLTVPITGTTPADTIKHFSAGWNLFGPLTSLPLPSSESMHDVYWLWNGDTYSQATSLLPGVGYWGYALGNTSLSLGE